MWHVEIDFGHTLIRLPSLPEHAAAPLLEAVRVAYAACPNVEVTARRVR